MTESGDTTEIVSVLRRPETQGRIGTDVLSERGSPEGIRIGVWSITELRRAGTGRVTLTAAGGGRIESALRRGATGTEDPKRFGPEEIETGPELLDLWLERGKSPGIRDLLLKIELWRDAGWIPVGFRIVRTSGGRRMTASLSDVPTVEKLGTPWTSARI